MNKPRNQSGPRQRESALYGVLRKYGASLPFADNIIATFQTERIDAGTVEGMLFAFDARIPLVFDRHWVVGDFDALPLRGERAMVRVTARPWIDCNGQMTLKAKHFVVLPPLCQADTKPLLQRCANRAES